MTSALDVVIIGALVLHAALLALAAWRLMRAKHATERLLSLELVSVLLLCVVLALALLLRQSLYVDVALALAALSFISTLALARYLAEQRMF